MRAAGRVVRLMLEAMKAAARSGITTAELDRIGSDVMIRNGALSGPTIVYNFPGVSCISVNEEVVHGVPGSRKLRNRAKPDAPLRLGGYMADAAETVIVGHDPAAASPQALGNRLAASAQRAFH